MVGYFEFELVGGIFPEAGIGGYVDLEDGEVVGVGKVYVGNLASVEFGNVCQSVENVIDQYFCCRLRVF